jgi:hypothetical protein
MSRPLRKLIAVFALVFGLTSTLGAIPVQSAGSYYPFGPQTNVSYSTVANAGWTICYTATFGDASTSLATIQTNCNKSYLLLAGSTVADTSTLLVLAAAPRSEVFTTTATSNTTHQANGSLWYFAPSWSMGFSDTATGTSLNSCDVTSSAYKICWHTNATTISSGYRIGTVNNASNSYQRYIFQSNLMSPSTTNISVSAGTAIYRQNSTLTAVTSGEGKVSFIALSKPISGCRNLKSNAANSFTVTCIWKPNVHAAIPVYATYTSTDNAFTNSTSAIAVVKVVARSNSR